MLMVTGQKAPSFSARDQNGNEIRLSQFRGNKIVLYFFPKSDTPACTTQSCNLRDHHEELLNHGFVVIGVSPDEQSSQIKFSKKFDLPFILISDPGKKIISRYGVWGEKQLYGKKYEGLLRTTFLIDEKGRISQVIHRPKNKEHAQQILNLVKTNGSKMK